MTDNDKAVDTAPSRSMYDTPDEYLDAFIDYQSREIERLRMSIRGHMEDKAVMADRIADQDLQIEQLQRRLSIYECEDENQKP